MLEIVARRRSDEVRAVNCIFVKRCGGLDFGDWVLGKVFESVELSFFEGIVRTIYT